MTAPWGAAGLVLPLFAIGGNPVPVSISVSPHFAFAPATVRVQVRVNPHPDNRTLVVEAAGVLYRRSDVPLEGEHAALRHVIEWRSLDAGEYTVIATVLSSTRIRGQARTLLHVDRKS